jgi:hypothetical protein
MKWLTHDLKEWIAYRIDLLLRGKQSAASKVLVALAIIIVPGGILLQSSGDVFQDTSAALSPLTTPLFNELFYGPSPTPTPVPGSGQSDALMPMPTQTPAPAILPVPSDELMPVQGQISTPTPTPDMAEP